MEVKTNFDLAIEKFLNNIESLRSTLPVVLTQIKTQREQSSTEYQKFLYDKCEYRETEGHYWISPENHRNWVKLKKEVTNSELASGIVNRSFLISLVSQFDTYIGDLMRCVFEIKPDFLDNSQRQLSFSELQTFEEIKDARDYIIEKEIEAVLRESHSEQFKWFESKLKMKLREGLESWPAFIETTQRRNLFVHNDGKVSSQYLNVCKQHKVKIKSTLKTGNQLHSNQKYFEQAFNCLFEIGLKLNQVLRRKLNPDDIESADKSFLNLTFELIVNEQLSLAKELFDFAHKYIKDISKKDFELRIQLNRAQTYKWLGDNEKCVEIIKEHDWSAFNDLFKLASQVLIDDFDNAILTMKSIGNDSNTMNKAFYRDWPIFKEFRKTEKFKEAYTEIYGDEGEIIEENKTT